MTAASQVARLDFSKPPPGYQVRRQDRIELWAWYAAETESTLWFKSEAEALAAAWAHYKARHDPPGMHSGHVNGARKYGFYPFGSHVIDGYTNDAEARAAAWAWYEARLALVRALEDDGVQTDIWPRALTWSDDTCTLVTFWLATPWSERPEMPEVLRG